MSSPASSAASSAPAPAAEPFRVGQYVTHPNYPHAILRVELITARRLTLRVGAGLTFVCAPDECRRPGRIDRRGLTLRPGGPA